MKMLELIETMRSEEASRERLMQDAGNSFRAIRSSPDYARIFSEGLKIIESAHKSREGQRRFEEAMNTQDFPLIFGDVIDRQMLGLYQEAPASWRDYCRDATVPDFRSVRRFAVDGGSGVLPAVGEQGPYLPGVLSETRYTYSVAKYGRTLNWTWESFINDDLGGLGASSPARLGLAARRSEEKFATQLFVDANGPHASFFTSGNGNIITANPALSIAGLQTGFIKLAAQTDADGEPIVIDMVTLVVPPALEVTAQNILNATLIRMTVAGGATGQELEAVNWMKSRLKLSVNHYIPIVASSSNTNTSWFLFASPQTGRPALEMGHLRGHEAPELFVKTGNQQRIGGASNPLDGDFENDVIAYKVRHVFGGTRLDPKSAVSSNGSGS